MIKHTKLMPIWHLKNWQKKKKKTLTSFKFDETETVTHKSSQNNPTTYKMLRKNIGFKQGAIGICILGGNWLRNLMCNPSKHENRIRRVSEEVL